MVLQQSFYRLFFVRRVTNLAKHQAMLFIFCARWPPYIYSLLSTAEMASNFHSLYCPGAVKVMGMGIAFFVAGLNLNIITLIKSDEVHKLPELNDLIASFFSFLLCSLPCDLNLEGWGRQGCESSDRFMSLWENESC